MKTQQRIKDGRKAMKQRLIEVLFENISETIEEVVADPSGVLDSQDWESFLLGLMDEAFELVLDCYEKETRVLVFGKGSLTRYKQQSLESIVSEFIESTKIDIEDREMLILRAIKTLESQVLRLKNELPTREITPNAHQENVS